MQPINGADPRRPNVQIAASIRAAILAGEFQPGEQLPSGEELAEFFGVTRVTIGRAIGTLRDEGFVTSRAGAGVYVQAALPAPQQEDHPLAGVAAFLFEMGRLKHTPRSGWLMIGIPQPETVAEHSFRVATIGAVLAALDGADVGRVVALGLFHDTPEARIGDIEAVGRAYLTAAAAEAITAHQTAGMPDDVAKVIRGLVAEYEACETREALLARDADKLETLLQAIEYGARGHDTADWQENALAALRTETGRQVGQVVGGGDPQAWLRPFSRSYLELHATAQRRGQQPRQQGGR